MGIFKLIFGAIFWVFVALNLGVNLGFGAEFGGNLGLNSNSSANFGENLALNSKNSNSNVNLATNSNENSALGVNLALNSNLGANLAAKNAPNLISVSIPPQKFIVQKIAGDTLKINVIIPAGTDEHNLDFKPATMKGLENSAIYFTIGLEIERVFAQKFKSVAGGVEFIDTGAGLRNLKNLHDHAHENHGENLAKIQSENLHSHGENSHHAHENSNSHANSANSHSENSHKKSHSAHENSKKIYSENSHREIHADSKDPHIWFDPVLLKAQAEIIAAALSKKYPQNKTLFETNLAKFQAELDALHAQISSILKGAKHKKFIIYHPSLAYFAARYNLTQIPVQIEGKEPKAQHLQRLIATAKKEQIQVIFVQKGFSQNAVKTLAKELGAKVLEIDNLSENFPAELLKIARILGD